MTIEQKVNVLANLLAVTDVVPPRLKDKVEGILLGVALVSEESTKQSTK